MPEKALIERYERDKPALRAMGAYVRDRVVDNLERRLGSAKKVRQLLRLAVEPRLKDDQSLIEKAFFRDKDYADPYDDITDKVGVRFVVLLSKEIALLNEAVEREPSWAYTKDRDFTEERKHAPLIFDYQSDHYVVRLRTTIAGGGIEIPAGTVCEIQIRTLLQHAYSELAHDTVYKAPIEAGTEVHRAFARSMALIETADAQLNAAAERVREATVAVDTLGETLAEKYKEVVGVASEDSRMNRLVLRVYSDGITGEALLARVDRLLKSRPYLSRELNERRKHDILCRQSAVLLVLSELHHDRHAAKARWPMQPRSLDGAFSILGISRD